MGTGSEFSGKCFAAKPADTHPGEFRQFPGNVPGKERILERIELEGRPLLTTAQVAKWLGVAARTICLWAELQELPGFKVGRQWRFREREIREWLRRRK